MTNPTDDALPEQAISDEDALRKRLVNRISVAAVVIVALLGGLAVIDALYVPPPAPPVQRLAEAPPPKADEAPAESPAESTQVAAEPEKTDTPPPDAPSTKVLKPLTVPAETKSASLRPSSPAARAEPAKEVARIASTLSPGHHAPPSKPLSQPAEPMRRFLVQMGVFNNMANAEELRAKLEAAQIPVQIEARVQVGPFATKAEAEAARTKLAALGMEPGILIANKK